MVLAVTIPQHMVSLPVSPLPVRPPEQDLSLSHPCILVQSIVSFREASGLETE